MFNLLITLLIGYIFGYLALKAKIPAGAMIGAMFSVAIFNIITGEAHLTSNIKILIQISAGAFIGTGITYKDIAGFKTMLKPAIIMIFGIVILNLFMGYLIYRFTPLDIITSFFAAAPGGMMDMTIISNDLGGDSPKVAVLHLVRFICVMTVIPNVGKLLSKKYPQKIKPSEEVIRSKKSNSMTFKEKMIALGITLAIAVIGGLLGYILRIPAGALSFSMIAVAVYNVITSKAYMPIALRRATQILAGILIGAKMNYSDLLELKTIIVPALLLVAGILLVNTILALIVYRLSDMDIVTCLFASTPAGVADMALIASELGADGPKVTVMQLSRYICVLVFFPLIIQALISLGI